MRITGKAKLAGVMGWPVGHSRSPQLHGFWLDRYGIDGAYLPLAVKPEDFADALRALPKLGFRGCNVTVPHKEAALACVDEADDLARRIGAVNTVIVREDGSLLGTNTDGFGFIENLRQGAAGWIPAGCTAVLIGAGGAARGVAVALMDGGAKKIILANRTAERAEALAADLCAGGMACKLEVVDWARRGDCLAEAGLLVNTSSLGMSGQPPLELSLDVLPKSALVTDIVYSPLQTDLLAAAAARGNATVDGLGMLLHQARPGFEAWFGVAPEVTDELRRYVLGDV